MKKDILKALKEQVLVCDGAMGTLLQQMGANKLRCPDEANSKYPELVTRIHEEYIRAGATIIETNTFGASRLKLAEFGLDKKIDEINSKAVKLARKAGNGQAYVSGSIGPLPDSVQPMGILSFDEAFELFYEQIGFLYNAGADFILFETFTNIQELRAAVIAAKEYTIPIQANMTFESGARTLSGTTPESFAVIMEGLGVDIIGTNCGSGPDEMLKIARKIATVTSLPLAILPNAGLPVIEKGKTVFKLQPKAFKQFATEAHDLGAAIIGGCCGTTPGHIRMLAQTMENKKPRKRKVPLGLKLASNTTVIHYSSNSFPLVIGERLNPTARKALSQELREKKLSIVKHDALEQCRNGADILDVNVSIGDPQEAALMQKVIRYVQKIVDVPLSIDTLNTETLEAGLKECAGRPIINSVNAEEKCMETVLPLAKKYGAALIALPLNEKGIPLTARKRVILVDKLLNRALAEGLRKEDLLFDCLSMAVSSGEGSPQDTLTTIQLAKKRGLYTVLGVSNVSYGMPSRSLLNAAFLTNAVQYGLDAGIINPNNERMKEALFAAAVLAKRESANTRFIQQFSKVISAPISKKEDSIKTIEEQLHEAILLGDRENIASMVAEALKKGNKPIDIGLNILTPALEEVGKKYERKEYFLPQLIMAAETMQEASTVLQKELHKNKDSFKEAGRIVLATVENDVHDIGKNIVKTVLQNYGYSIVDLGKNVTAEKIVAEAKKHNADIIGLSALMTTTMMRIKEVIDLIKESSLPFKTLIGGAVVTQDFANKIGADGYGRDAVHAVEVVKKIISEKEK